MDFRFTEEQKMVRDTARKLGERWGERMEEIHRETLSTGRFSEELYGIIQAYVNARLLRTAPISREMVLNQVAEHVLGLPRSY